MYLHKRVLLANERKNFGWFTDERERERINERKEHKLVDVVVAPMRTHFKREVFVIFFDFIFLKIECQNWYLLVRTSRVSVRNHYGSRSSHFHRVLLRFSND